MSKEAEYIIYEGNVFQVEWYYNENSNSQPLDFFNDLSESAQEDFLVLVKKLADIGYINNKTKFRNEGDKLFAFKPKPNRFMCFFYKGGKVIVVHGFEKKRQDLPRKEKEMAKKRMADYLERLSKGEYYGK